MSNSVMQISMGSSTFDELKYDMTATLQDAIRKMEEVGSEKATVTVKITIQMDRLPVTGEKEYRDAKVPKFKHKVGYSVPVTDARDGEFGGEYELAKDGNAYTLKPLDGQTSMFDEDDETEEDDEE